MESYLLNHLIERSAEKMSHHIALKLHNEEMTYEGLLEMQDRFACGLLESGAERGSRIGIFLNKTFETIAAAFGSAKAGCAFVPINPVLKPSQVEHILKDCNVRVLVTSPERFSTLSQVLKNCFDLKMIVIVGDFNRIYPMEQRLKVISWDQFTSAPRNISPRLTELDMAAILYTSGSTGMPKGVVLSHKNLVVGAKSVAGYLENHSQDKILAVLPLSFDAGFSQLTTAFHVGAQAVLLDYLMPNEVTKIISKEKITGLTAVPPLWIQLAEQKWDANVSEHLRYIANTGGKMPREVLARLRKQLPKTKPFLMYGLTEAFRSTYLPPEEVDRRPDSIGKAIPNAEVMVLRQDGSHCDVNEPGELVHRGPLVTMGYWNDAQKTAERFKLLPNQPDGVVFKEHAVFSGDTVKVDAEGYLYFIGRKDEMIKTSGYRVSPVEVEETIYAADLVCEVAAFGAEHPNLGQAIIVAIVPKAGESITKSEVLESCRKNLPTYMVPSHVEIFSHPLPRNPNGKIDRKSLATAFADSFIKPQHKAISPLAMVS